MSQSTQVPCADSDPDITGIGVTLAVLLQAFCNLIASGVAVYDGKIDKGEADAIFGLSKENLFLSGGLILTSAIQLAQGKLSAYHAVMVLQMTWVLEGPLMTSYDMLDSRIARRWRKNRAIDVLDADTPGHAAFWLSIFRLGHGIFAIIVWVTIARWPGNLTCTDATFLWPNLYVGKPFALVLFLPLSLIRVVEALWRILTWIWKKGKKGEDAQSADEGQGSTTYEPVDVNRHIVGWRIVVAFVLVFLVGVGAVLVIWESGKLNLVAWGEVKFGFGQILALVLLVSRLWAVLVTIKAQYTRPKLPKERQNERLKKDDLEMDNIRPEVIKQTGMEEQEAGRPRQRVQRLPPSVEGPLTVCPKLRILVAGNTGVGKSSLVSSVFNIGIKDIDIVSEKQILLVNTLPMPTRGSSFTIAMGLCLVPLRSGES